MPLTIFPVPFLSDPNPKDKEQNPIVPAPSTRKAITLRLPIEVARALKDASANVKPGGQPAVRVTLSGDKPGLSISGRLFPFDLALKPTSGPNEVAELYSRTRHQFPRKPADHRPPLTLQSAIVGHAVVEDAAQKLRDRKAEADQAKKDRRIQVLETPPPATTSGATGKATTTKKKKNAAARTTATASTLERNVLQKGVAMKSSTATPPAASSSKASPSPNGTAINGKQTPASSSSNPTSPATSPVDSRPLEERIIHLLATKSQTVQELEGLTGASRNDISEILRRVATTHGQSSTSENWISSSSGLWALSLSSYALVYPWTWPAYTDRDRVRIAKDMENAFDQAGLPHSAPERLKLKEAEARWKKRMAARSASGTAATPGTTQRKPKINKMSDPPNATGGMLSASSVKSGMAKSTSANGVTTAISTTTTTTTVKKKTKKVDGTGSARDSDVEMKERPKKRVSPSEPSRSGAVTPMSASSSNGSTASGSSGVPLRHGLPVKPQGNMGPSSSATGHSRQASGTPPPPRPSGTPTQSPRPAASPKVAPAQTKRKLDEMSDLDDAISGGKSKSARPISSASNPAPQEVKRRRLEPSPLGAGSSTAASSRTVNGTSGVKVKREVSREDVGSREAQQQSLKPPPTQANGRAPAPAVSRSGSVTGTKSDRETPTSTLPKFGRKEPSPLGPSAIPKGAVNGKEKSTTTPNKADERAQSRLSGKGRSTPIYTSSSEEEEDPEAAAEAARKAALRKKKRALAAQAATAEPSPAPVAAPRLRKVKPLPDPLTRDRRELRLMHAEKSADMLAARAELQAESARIQRCIAGQGDPASLWSEQELQAKGREYEALREQVLQLDRAVHESLRADGLEE